jgi:hypothetical protein
MAKTDNAPAPRRPSEPSIAEAIKPHGIPLDTLLADHAAGLPTTPPNPAPAKLASAKEAAPAKEAPAKPALVGFAKLSLSIAADLARALRIAAVVEHNVSESALVEVALRRFLELPAAEQAKALDGIGRRRKTQ